MGLLVIVLCALAVTAWCGCVVLADRSLAGGLVSFVLGLALLVGAAQLTTAPAQADASSHVP